MKIKKGSLINLTFIIVAVIIGYFVYPKPKLVETHYHAGFYVYIDGKLQDFSGAQYMSVTYCELNNSTPTKEEKAHLHDNVGDVVHIHSKDVKWIDLFNGMAYQFPKGETVIGYINGKEVKDILNQVVVSYESVIIAAGDTKGINIKKYVPLSHIKDVESRSEYCGVNKRK